MWLLRVILVPVWEWDRIVTNVLQNDGDIAPKDIRTGILHSIFPLVNLKLFNKVSRAREVQTVHVVTCSCHLCWSTTCVREHKKVSRRYEVKNICVRIILMVLLHEFLLQNEYQTRCTRPTRIYSCSVISIYKFVIRTERKVIHQRVIIKPHVLGSYENISVHNLESLLSLIRREDQHTNRMSH